ncbi:MAG: BatA domain-containing protein [Saprospiraceae bacterium]
MYFTNVHFLKEVKEETSARRKIRDLLVLLARMMALAFLVLGFAQPFLGGDEDTPVEINRYPYLSTILFPCQP